MSMLHNNIRQRVANESQDLQDLERRIHQTLYRYYGLEQVTLVFNVDFLQKFPSIQMRENDSEGRELR